MRRSAPCDDLSEALHLNSQVNLINERALELDKVICYIQEWLSVFQADAAFAEHRIVEIKRSIVACEDLTMRARKTTNALSSNDPDLFFQVPDLSEPASASEHGGVSDEAADPSVVAKLNELTRRLRATSREINKVCEGRRVEAQSSKVILEKAENLLMGERQNLEQWLFLKNDLLRKKTAFSAFAAVVSGAAADYRCCKASLEDRVGALLAAGSASL